MHDNLLFKYSIKKSKDNLLLIIGMILFLTIVFLVINFSLIILDYFKDYMTRNIDNRELIVYRLNTGENINDIDHVTQVSLFSYSHIVFDTDKYNTIELIGLDDKELFNIRINGGGKNIGEGKIICPSEFIPYSDSNSSNNIYHSDEIINKSFNGMFDYYEMTDAGPRIVDTMTKRFSVVGTYDSKEYMNNNNVCYSSIDDIKEVMNFMTGNNVKDNIYAVIVDNINNLEKVKAELEKRGFNVNYKVNNDITTISILITTIIVIIASIFFMISIIINHSIKRDMIEKHKEILLYRAIGYSDRQILKVYNIEYDTVFIISTISSIVSSLIIFIVLKNTINNIFEFKLLSFNVHVISIIIVILIGLLYSKFIVNKNIKRILSENRIIL
jgi:CBS domain-containing protein